ncbi:hypothetical protein Aperf_G00000026817 [Anoplocephala perfoliata]
MACLLAGSPDRNILARVFLAPNENTGMNISLLTRLDSCDSRLDLDEQNNSAAVKTPVGSSAPRSPAVSAALGSSEMVTSSPLLILLFLPQHISVQTQDQRYVPRQPTQPQRAIPSSAGFRLTSGVKKSTPMLLSQQNERPIPIASNTTAPHGGASRSGAGPSPRVVVAGRAAAAGPGNLYINGK